jgi:hypothetical protein
MMRIQTKEDRFRSTKTFSPSVRFCGHRDKRLPSTETHRTVAVVALDAAAPAASVTVSTIG